MDAEGINLNHPLKKPKLDPDAVITSASVGDVETANSPNPDRGDENNEEDDSNCYDDDDYLYADNDDEVVDNYAAYLQAQLDKADLPPGVEASVSLSFPPESTASSSNTDKTASSWVSAVKLLEAGRGKESDPGKKYKDVKAFDVVDDFPDHHFKEMRGFGKPTKEWTKKVQDEWRILEKDLPETIFVRACESRMDLMRAAITGPQGTPYHDGLFMFDIHFPPEYPLGPPKVNYHAGGLRINPNLYENGYVCLSLLNTWQGSECEMWQPKQSTMLQVLVSIQALILNDKPYFNEPGYEAYKGPQGEQSCIQYSEKVLLFSLKTMSYTINRPPKHFEDLVAAHFGVFGHDILAACNAYLAGAPVGSVVKGEFPADKKITNLRSSVSFNVDLAKMMNALVPIFSECGVKDCDQFLVQL